MDHPKATPLNPLPHPEFCVVPNCGKKAKTGQPYCHEHGQKAFTTPMTRGTYSKYLPKNLGEIIDRAYSEDEDLTLIEELHVLRALMIEKMQELDSEMDSERFKKIKSKASSLNELLSGLKIKFDLNKQDQQELLPLMKLVSEIMDETESKERKDKVKGELRTLLTEVRDMARSEAAIRYSKQTSISAKEISALLGVVLGAISKYVENDATIYAIRSELGRYLSARTNRELGPAQEGRIESNVGGFVNQNERQEVNKVSNE